MGKSISLNDKRNNTNSCKHYISTLMSILTYSSLIIKDAFWAKDKWWTLM